MLGGLAIWDVLSNQFGWPKLGTVLGLGTSNLPVWAWVDMALLLLIVALFEMTFENARRPQTSSEDQQIGAEPEPAPTVEETPLERDMTLTDVEKALEAHGFVKLDDAARELADKVVSRRMHVWARSGNEPLSQLSRGFLQRSTFNLSTGKLVRPGPYEEIKYQDIRFLRSEVEQVWPPSG